MHILRCNPWNWLMKVPVLTVVHSGCFGFWGPRDGIPPIMETAPRCPGFDIGKRNLQPHPKATASHNLIGALVDPAPGELWVGRAGAAEGGSLAHDAVTAGMLGGSNTTSFLIGAASSLAMRLEATWLAAGFPAARADCNGSTEATSPTLFVQIHPKAR
jgi:hypothetical protein